MISSQQVLASSYHRLLPKHKPFVSNLTRYFPCQINVAFTQSNPVGGLQRLHTSFHASNPWGSNPWSPSNVWLPILAVEQPALPTCTSAEGITLQRHNLPGNTYHPFLSTTNSMFRHLTKESNRVPVRMCRWTLSKHWHTKPFIHTRFMKPPVDITHAPRRNAYARKGLYPNDYIDDMN